MQHSWNKNNILLLKYIQRPKELLKIKTVIRETIKLTDVLENTSEKSSGKEKKKQKGRRENKNQKVFSLFKWL